MDFESFRKFERIKSGFLDFYRLHSSRSELSNLPHFLKNTSSVRKRENRGDFLERKYLRFR